MNGIIVGYYKKIITSEVVYYTFNGDFNIITIADGNYDLFRSYNTKWAFEELKEQYLERTNEFNILYRNDIIYNNGYILGA